MKKASRPQASSGRAFGGSGFGGGFGGSGFGVSSSPLSWIGEPPDLSSISDPHVGVAFKNLTKKDSTTKAKALEELQAHVSSPEQQVEEAVLDAWVPRSVLLRHVAAYMLTLTDRLNCTPVFLSTALVASAN